MTYSERFKRYQMEREKLLHDSEKMTVTEVVEALRELMKKWGV